MSDTMLELLFSLFLTFIAIEVIAVFVYVVSERKSIIKKFKNRKKN